MANLLRDYRPPRKTVTVSPSLDLEFRALTAVDIMSLVGGHLPELRAVVEKFIKAKKDIFTQSGVDQLMLTLATDAPVIVAHMIALCAGQDDAESAEAAQSLPLATTIICVSTIVQLTLEESGGLKNLSASVASLVQAKNGTAEVADLATRKKQ